MCLYRLIFVRRLLVFFVLCILTNLSTSFMPNQYVPFLSGNDYTHADITEIGILEAVAEFFENNPPPGKPTVAPGSLTGIPDITARKLYDNYYGGSISDRRFQDAIDDIVKQNNKVDQDHYNEAMWHCNGEQIREGNIKMHVLRENILQILNASSPNYDAARELIGQYLHILQMFYSNTNWIELFGEKAYFDLGIQGKPLMATAKYIPNTCHSCGTTVGIPCITNLEPLGNVLTSGYKTGQDMHKPYKDPKTEKQGKCSHGGPRDTSGTTSAATGGINKDTLNPTYSPHFHLHNKAALSAIEHTKYFFADPTYGLRTIIGDDKFQDLLQLRPGNSLVFVIDTTGSMREDLDAIIQKTKEIVHETNGTDLQPYNYIVVTFNDPGNLTTVRRTKDPNEMITWLSAIKIQGGDDCPEFSLTGIQAAAVVANPNSKVYVFTDASPKDPEKINFITSLVTEKKIQVEFLITGQCTSRRKRSLFNDAQYVIEDEVLEEETHDLEKRSDTPFKQIVETTDVFNVNRSKINNGFEIINNSIKTNMVYIIKQMVDMTKTSLVQIPVDASIKELDIRIQGDLSMPYPYLQGPQGTHVNADGNTITQQIYDGNIFTYSIKNPEKGVWSIYKLDGSNWNLEVIGQSRVDFMYKFLETGPSESSKHEIRGIPESGRLVDVVILINPEEDIKHVERTVFLDDHGNEIAQAAMEAKAGNRARGIFESSIIIPTQDFRVAIDGRDKHGNRFMRTHYTILKHPSKRSAKGKRVKRAAGSAIVWHGINFYQQIAQVSGGHIFSTTKTNIGKAVNVVKNSLPSSEVTILRQTMIYGAGACDEFIVQIDDSVTQFTLRIDSQGGMPFYIMKNPQNQIAKNYTRDIIGGRFLVYTVKGPTIGKWKIKKIDKYDWEVDVTAQSPIDFTSRFLETGPDGFSQYEITGRPIAGRNTTVVVRVKEIAKLQSLDEVILMNKYGQIIASSPLKPKQGRHALGMYISTIVMPSEEFMVGVKGKDKHNRVFQRLHTTIISTLSIKLEKLAINGPFYTKEVLLVPFRVTNIGSGYTTVDVDITDDKGFTHPPINQTFNIPGGENVTGIFQLLGNTSGVTTTVTISARPRGLTGTKFQYVILRLTTQDRTTKKVDNFPPVCTVLKTTGKCTSDICKCNESRVEAEAEVWDYGFGLNQVIATGAGSDANFTHDPFKVGDIKNISGVVNVKLNVNCCRKEAYITVSDVDGHQGQCTIQVNKDYKKDECKPDTKDKDKDDPPPAEDVNTAVMAGMGAGAGAVVIASVVTSVIIVKKKLAASAASSTAVTPFDAD